MAKYLMQGSYTSAGVPGLLKEGGSKRVAHFRGNVEKAGGTLEAAYFAFGSDDLVAIVDLPNHASVAALSLGIAAGGAFRPRVTVLLSPEEIDEASGIDVGYRAPGG